MSKPTVFLGNGPLKSVSINWTPVCGVNTILVAEHTSNPVEPLVALLGGIDNVFPWRFDMAPYIRGPWGRGPRITVFGRAPLLPCLYSRSVPADLLQIYIHLPSDSLFYI